MIKKTELIKKCRKIKLIISDVDGVLTDGGMYYGKTGEIMKKFNTRDGMGVSLISDKVKINLMTRENSEIVLRRAKKMKVDHVYMGIKDKELLLPEICKKYKILKEEVAYIGDAVNDLKIMKRVGLSIAPNDANRKIRDIADYICKTKGGEGVLREFTELILSTYNLRRPIKEKDNR